MMKKSLFAAALILILATASYAGPDMQEGRWEITSTMEMPGMPAPIPPMTTTQCLTDKDLIPRNTQQSNECKIVDTAIKGNTVSWKMVCNTQVGTTKGDGSITYMGDRFEGAITMVLSGPDQPSMTMTTRMKGRRIGDCK